MFTRLFVDGTEPLVYKPCGACGRFFYTYASSPYSYCGLC